MQWSVPLQQKGETHAVISKGWKITPLAARNERRRGKLHKHLDLLQQRILLPSQEPQPLAALCSPLNPAGIHMQNKNARKGKKGKKGKKS